MIVDAVVVGREGFRLVLGTVKRAASWRWALAVARPAPEVSS